MNVNNIKLKTKFAVLIVVLFVIALIGSVAWTSYAQREQTINELREKGLVLSQQMSAVWDFMSANQDRFEATAFAENGSYQGLHCAVAGRSIGKLFSNESGYLTRFVNFDPRNSEDTPDEFEAEALNAFRADPGLTEYYAVTKYDGQQVFRYLAPMKIERTCLECHGEPKGEIDVTGHPKEGWAIDDIGGAISIVIPMDLYVSAEQDSVLQNVVFFIVVLVACLLIVYFSLSHLVTNPLRKIREGVSRIQTGDLDVRLDGPESSFEMNTLAAEFNDMAHELSGLYENLEAQVDDRTAQLANANDVLERQRVQLERANELLRHDNEYKSSFLAMMSHELRTPLTSILAYAELLNREGDPAYEKEAEALSEIEANGRVLLLMINDILEMSRLDAGKTQLAVETVDLGDVVGLVQSVVQPLARRNNISFACEIDPNVPLMQGDFEKIRHILENLCGNAMKFTHEGGNVKLNAEYDSEAREVVIKVSDTGIGIAQKDQQRIFERFVQVDSSVSRRYNGTGLGLALAKEYTEMHGGTISVESELGSGSTFIVRLPEVPRPERWHNPSTVGEDLNDAVNAELPNGAGAFEAAQQGGIDASESLRETGE